MRLNNRIENLLSFEFTDANWQDALRGIIVTAIITAIPISMGDLKSAVPISIGAVFAAISEARQPFTYRWQTMLGTTIAMMFTAFLGALISEDTWLAIALTAPVAFICAYMGAFGKRAATGGLLALIVFTIYVGISVPVADAYTNASLIGLGAIVQTIVMVLTGLLRGQHLTVPVNESKTSLSQHQVDRFFLNHATQLMIILTIATAITENYPLPHEYWLPMSIAWMSKPDSLGTIERVTHRLTGTIIGLMLIAGLTILAMPGEIGFFLFSMFGVTLTLAFIWANYAVAVTGVTIWVIALLGMLSDPIIETLDIRLLATLTAAIFVVAGKWKRTDKA